MKFKKILKSADDENRHVFGLSDSDIVLISSLVQNKLTLIEMGAEKTDDSSKNQLETIMSELSVAIAEDEKTNA